MCITSKEPDWVADGLDGCGGGCRGQEAELYVGVEHSEGSRHGRHEEVTEERPQRDHPTPTSI